MVDRPSFGVSVEAPTRRPVVIEIHDTMPGPPEVVWALLTDWERQGEWMREASEFEVIGRQREGVGVEARAKVRIAGITTRDRIRVTMWEPPRILVIEHQGWVKGTGELQMVPVKEGTRIRWRESLFPPARLGPLGVVGLRSFAPVLRRIFRRDLRVLRGLVRARAGDRA
jgi:carbon monoxide dehydrogenase subunit G